MKVSLPAAMVAACLAGPAAAVEEPIGDIAGPWIGKGFVQKDERSKPVTVNCAVEGQQNGDQLGFEGECRAFLVVKREIGAELKRSGDSYTGTYTGSSLGIAALAGTQTDPQTLDFIMTFPREVNGDRRARLIITRPDDGTFTITTEDEMASGELVTTSQITFARE